MLKIFFHFPKFETFVSGGNSYNKNFLAFFSKKYPAVKAENIEEADVVISDTIFLNKKETFNFLNRTDLKKIIIIHHLKYFENNNYLEEFDWLKKFDLLIANSNFTATELQKNGIDNNKIVVVEPLVQSPYLLEKKYSQSIRALMAANWVERKGFEEMFNAIKTKRNYTKNLSITIFGEHRLDNIYYDKCIRIINENVSLSKMINIKEVLPPEKMLATYQNYNLFISASKMETYGMAVKEALNNGLYVLALNRGNIPYLINEPKQGKLFNHINDLVEFLLCLDENKLEFLNKIKLHQAAENDSIAKFSLQINHFINQLMKLFN